jgi:FKBP-type peptidyl-prolyl cis-trans isomerase
MQNIRRLVLTFTVISLLFTGCGSVDIKETPSLALEEKNLKNAQNFLSKIAHNPGIHEVQIGKLYYEVLQEGNEVPSPQILETALFHYTIMTLDETIVANTYADGQPKKVRLSNAIVGFRQGINGMKTREKRRLYIHPDLAYRRIGIFVQPQSLIIIEVELIPS